MAKTSEHMETAAEAAAACDERKALWLHVYRHHCCVSVADAQCEERANNAVAAFDKAFPAKGSEK